MKKVRKITHSKEKAKPSAILLVKQSGGKGSQRKTIKYKEKLKQPKGVLNKKVTVHKKKKWKGKFKPTPGPVRGKCISVTAIKFFCKCFRYLCLNMQTVATLMGLSGTNGRYGPIFKLVLSLATPKVPGT